MPKTQRLIVACLALIIGVFIGILLSHALRVEAPSSTKSDATASVQVDAPAVLELLKAKLIEKGITVSGFTPFLLVEQFPGVKEEDFDGAEAVVGKYVFNGSVLVYEGEITDTTAVADLTEQGFATFVSKYAARTKITETPEAMVASMLQQEAPAAEVPTESGEEDFVACTLDAKMCPDGSYVGRTAPDCQFEACPGERDDASLPTEITCTPEQREAEACIEIYAAVCAAKQVECVTTPCEPVEETYPNSCFACAEDRVISYTDGACTPE